MATAEQNERFSRMEALFHGALSQPEETRDAWLQEQCGTDMAMLADTRALLRALHEEENVTEAMLSAQREGRVERRRLGPYEILSLLGRGGMGAVYLAERADGQYEKKVAIKLVDLPLATEIFFERFRQERQILAGLDHPSIARMLDGGISDDGILYLVMEYVDGEPIDAWCRAHTPSLEEKLQLFVKVCRAVQFAHQNLVIHRDLKPDNILVSADGAPHLLDFGTAKLLSADRTADTQGLTRQGFLSFTPDYASPEQVLGKPITTATDTYSLGVLLYLLLTGHLPYQLSEYTTEEMVQVICEKSPQPPSSTDGTFPDADLEAILGKSLRKEPEERYGTADQLAADVEAYLGHRPVQARKGTLRYKATKFARRNRLAISFVALLLLTLIGGSLAVLWQAREARRAEQRAEARSADLLQLSDSLLSELDTAIQQLPGSTGAQQLLVARVLESLERMPADVKADKQAGLDLANAYVRLGNLQGDPYEQNIGDTPGAARSLDKAMAILNPLAAKYPGDADVLRALANAQDARGEILSQVDVNAAVDNLKASIQTYDRLLALPNPTPKLYFAAADVYDILGDVMGQDMGFSDLAEAKRDYQHAIDMDNRALSIDPAFPSSRRGLVVMEMKLSNVDLDIDPPVALNEIHAAMNRLYALSPAEQAMLVNLRMRGLLFRKQAVGLAELGHYSEAEPSFEQSMSVYSSIAAADPKDRRAVRDLFRLLNDEIQSEEHAANPALSEPGFDRTRAMHRTLELSERRTQALNQLLEADPHDADLLVERDAIRVHESAIHEQLHESTDTARTRDALDALRKAARDPKASSRELELAFDAFMIAEPTSLRDPAFLLECAQRGANLTHERTVDWMLMLAQASRINGNIARAQEAARKGLAILPPETPDNKNFRMRKLLEIEAAGGSR